MLKFIQLFIVGLSLCNAFQGIKPMDTRGTFVKMALDNNEKNVPRLSRDDAMQPIQRGNALYQ